MKNKKGITLISLVITIVVLVILSAVAIYLTLGNNGILNKAEQAKNETIKQTATEKMNLKITNMQIEKYAEEQRMPTLQEFADGLCEDDEIQYVQLQSKKVGSLSKIEVGEAESIFTKLKEYPYEFEINSSLQLASIDGIQVAASDTVTIPKEEYEALKQENSMSETEHFTGKYWLDGRKIYEITRTFKTDSNSGNQSSPISMPDNVDNVTIDLSKSYVIDKYDNIGYFNTPYDSTAYCYLYYNTSNNKFYYILGSAYTSCFATLTVQYTKTTDNES